MTVQEFYSLAKDACSLITQKERGAEVFRRPTDPPKGMKRIFVEKIVSERFFEFFDEKHPESECLSWLHFSQETSEVELFWYPAGKADALVPGDEGQALFLEFKVFDKETDGHKGCDVRNAFMQLLQYMMKDSRPNKEGAVVVFDIWNDATKDRHFAARPHDKEFVWQLQKMPCARDIHLIWIWFDRETNKVLCDMCLREEDG